MAALPWQKESFTIINLALPMIATGLLEASNGFVNVLFAAHLGTAQLAANALVSSLFITLMVIVWGFVSAVSILIAHYHGAQNAQGIAGTLRAGIYLSLLLSLPMMALLWFAPCLFRWSGQSLTIVSEAHDYLHALMWAIPFDLAGFTLMQLFSGLAKPKITLLFSLFYLPLMIGLNYLFVFGDLGFPTLGLAGLGWGTTIAYAAILIVVSLFIWRKPHYRYYWQLPVADLLPYAKELLRIGLPIGFTFCIEISFFFVAALFMGKISEITLASYQIVMQYFWITSMAVYSFSQALTIRLSWRLGRQEPQWIKVHFLIGQGVAFCYSLVIALIYCMSWQQFLRYDLGYVPALSTSLSHLTMKFFMLLALFQVFDNIRSICLSMLRGLKDTRFALLMAISTFWFIALPLSYYSIFHGATPRGELLWVSVSISVILASLIMILRLKILSKRWIKISTMV